jgi:hypothetical protein
MLQTPESHTGEGSSETIKKKENNDQGAELP